MSEGARRLMLDKRDVASMLVSNEDAVHLCRLIRFSRVAGLTIRVCRPEVFSSSSSISRKLHCPNREKYWKDVGNAIGKYIIRLA